MAADATAAATAAAAWAAGAGPPTATELQGLVWGGAIPIELSMKEAEVTGLVPPLPHYVRTCSVLKGWIDWSDRWVSLNGNASAWSQSTINDFPSKASPQLPSNKNPNPTNQALLPRCGYLPVAAADAIERFLRGFVTDIRQGPFTRRLWFETTEGGVPLKW